VSSIREFDFHRSGVGSEASARLWKTETEGDRNAETHAFLVIALTKAVSAREIESDLMVTHVTW